MHDNELSLRVSGMIQRNLRKTYLRIILVCTCAYVRVYRYVHVDIVWIWRYGIIVHGRDLKIYFPQLHFDKRLSCVGVYNE